LKKSFFFIFLILLLILIPSSVFAATANPYAQALNVNKIMASPQFGSSIQMILGISMISLVPFFLISITSFLRIIVVLSLVRTSIGTQQVPPSSVLVSLAIFMTIFVMAPVWNEVNQNAVTPYSQGKISEMKAVEIGLKPIRNFMVRQVREKDLELFVGFAKIAPPKTVDEVPTQVLIPAFMISELKTAFQIGFLLFVPFLIVDLVVSNILLSLGMFMLSPVMVSLPFKILLFVLVDGWNLICKGLLLSFR